MIVRGKYDSKGKGKGKMTRMKEWRNKVEMRERETEK